MSEFNLPEAALPKGYQVATTVVTPLPAERAYPLTNADFLTLCDGTSGSERAGKDLYLGLFVSAIVGIVGLFSSVDWSAAIAQKTWMPQVCVLILASIAAASACGCAVHWKRMLREDTAYTRLERTISDFFQAQAPASSAYKKAEGSVPSQISSPAMRAQFTDPPNGAKVPRTPILSGTLENIPAGTEVWLVVETGTVYHPQHEALPTNSRAFRASVFIGGKGNAERGQEFPVHVLAVTEDVSKAFRRYQKDSASSNKWVGVPKPADSKILATLKVIRDDSASI